MYEEFTNSSLSSSNSSQLKNFFCHSFKNYSGIMLKNFNNYNYIRGFFDADGSWSVKFYRGSQKPVSFHINITFSQKDTTVLQSILESVEATETRISKRTHRNPSGNISKTGSISFALSNPAAEKLLTVWADNPPVSPTKYLDYRIVLVLARVNTECAVSIVNQLLPSLNITDLRTASLALLYLRSKMYGSSKTNVQAKLVSIEKHYQTLRATAEEIEQSIAIGEQLYLPIGQDVANHVNNLVICENYLLGYHAADGCFSITTEFNSLGTSFKGKFFWSLTDCIENKPILETVKRFLEAKGISFTENSLVDYTTYARLQITTTGECAKLVNLFDQWGAMTAFSEVRLNQYKRFYEAINLYQNPNFRNDYSLCSRFIELKWKMNVKKRSNTVKPYLKRKKSHRRRRK